MKHYLYNEKININHISEKFCEHIYTEIHHFPIHY